MAWIIACGGGSPAPSVPDGRTVTPINDVTIWQQCAGIANPTYTTLSEILADVGVLSVLMASNNAVDYLVRCKNFIGIRPLVPTMTSDTTPSGVCSSSGVWRDDAGFQAYKAFDNSSDTAWVGTENVKTGYLQYDFGSAVTIGSLQIDKRVGNAPKQVKVQASQDGNSFVDISNTITITNVTDNQTILLNDTSYTYRYYRLNILDSYGAQPYVWGLQIYSEYGLCDNLNAMTYIGQNNYCANTLLADSDWCNAICNSTYFESVLNVKVPTMTSNTTPSGTVSASTYILEPYKAFDGDDSSYWVSNGGVPQYIEYDFGHDVLIAKMKYLGYATNNTLNGYEITGFDSDNIDHLLISGNMQNVGTMQSVNIFTNSAKYRKYRLKATSMYSGQQPNAKTIQFYGREDV